MALLGLAFGAEGQARVLPSINARTPPPPSERGAAVPADPNLLAQGARIGEIRFNTLDLFDQQARDEDTLITRLANRLHVATRISTIEDQLLFRSGDPYQPGQLEESARILRDTRYLRDASIRPVAFHDGVVDVEVTTQDVWAFTPSVSFGRRGGRNSSGVELEHLNFLGTGTQVGFGYKSGVDRDSKFVHYRDRQLGSSWWDLSAQLADNSDGRLAELSLDHPFYALDTRWAGGVELLGERRRDARYDLGDIVDQFDTSARRASIYFGRSAGLVDGWARRLTAGFTFDEHRFTAVTGAHDTQLLPGDRRLAYPWLGVEWVQDAFRTDRNRDQIEKTEDYSLGWRAHVQLGFASPSLGADRSAAMLQGNLSRGMSLTARQSLMLGMEASGRVEGGSLTAGLLHADARYYFRQSTRRLFFMSLSASAGTHLDADQQVLLGGDNGLRGYPLRYQAGTGRWLFTAEQRLFTDWYPFQLFNVGAAVFYDMGATFGRDPLGTPSQGLLRDVGVAARRRCGPATRQFALGTRQRPAPRYRQTAGRRSVAAQRAVPHRDAEELLMYWLPARRRPMLRVETLVLIVAAFLVAGANGGWWSAVLAGREWDAAYTWLFLGATFVSLVALHFALLAPLAFRAVVRPLLSLVVVAAGSAAYYMNHYAVVFDPDMIRNVLSTDAHEARELLTWEALAWLSAWSALPLAFIWFVRIERRTWGRALLLRAGCIAAALVVTLLALLPVSRDITALMRNQREARYLVTPGNLLYGLAMQLRSGVADANAAREPVGRDARVMHVAMGDAPPRVLVLVIGETARAANFSMLGYPRETNPELSKLDVVAFKDVTACGTSTEVSVPCMFSPFGREDYDEHRIRNSESLLDVLVRAGFRVKWLDNQSGCKGVCRGAGVEYQKLTPTQPGQCDGGECHDGELLVALRDELARLDGDTVLVLHMMGNHGPAYYKRYPREFRRFLPDCETSELRDCDRREVVNAYDNAILYTDHVLAGVVRELQGSGPRINGAMLYVSDHGESLGEKGLYLHGMPYAIAPSEQIHVPMVVWLSPQTTRGGDVNLQCLRRKSGDALSHDYLFHSVLGLLNVRTEVYRASRDFFDGCRGGTYRVMAGH
jgi:glucan phosphoethanolaminetransferase (alkaline phosphatase superfamily)